jgi:hypothetical protein
VSPTFGDFRGGFTISLTALRFREIIASQKPRFYVDNNDITSNITAFSVVSDKFSTSIAFTAPQVAGGRRLFTLAHPDYLGSQVNFSFDATLPVRLAQPLFTNIRRNTNVTLQIVVTNFLHVSSLDISTRNSPDYPESLMKASILSFRTVSPNVVLVTIVLPASNPSQSQSQVIWTVRDNTAGNVTFSLTLDASDAPSLASLSPTSVSSYGGSQLTFIVTSFSFAVTLKDWICSFPFSNVSAHAVARIDATTASVQCIAPSNIQAITASETLQCALVYQQADNVYSLSFGLTFVAPPALSLTFSDGSDQISADSASVFVRNFAPFSSIELLRIFIGGVRIPIRSFIVRNGILQLQFSVNCLDCNCCSGQKSIFTVTHTQFPMMSASVPVVVSDPSAPSVVLVSPSIISASGGTIVEIQIKNLPLPSAALTVSVGTAAPAVVFQVLSTAGSTTTSLRFFSPVHSSGSVGYVIRLDGDVPVVSVESSSSYALVVSDLIVSGKCSHGSLPAFGGIIVKCVVDNLPIPSENGLLEFRYMLRNSTVLASSRNLKYLQTGATTLSIDLDLPNCSEKVSEVLSIVLQIRNINFGTSIFSASMDLVPSLPRVLFVDPSSGPNNKPVNVMVYVEFFSGPLFSAQALLDGVPLLLPSNLPPARLSATITAVYFVLPAALSAGSHFVSFWSGDRNSALSVLFTTVDALQPKLIRISPSQASTSGGDAVSISVMNFNFNMNSTLMLGSTVFAPFSFDCQAISGICIITALVPKSSVGHFNISLVTGEKSFILPQTFATVDPVPSLDFCTPSVGVLSGGARVTCYFLNIKNASGLSDANVSGRFDLAPSDVSGISISRTVFSVVLIAPASVFEGNSTVHVTIGASSFNYPFLYVRPCNYESYCSSRGFIPFDLKLLKEPSQNDICSEIYCLDPKVLPIPSVDLVSPSVVSTIGNTLVTLFSSNILAAIASDISVSLESSRSSVPVSATVASFDAGSSDIVFLAPPLPLEGSYSVIVSTRRSRQLVVGTKELVSVMSYEAPIIGKAFVSSIFPTSVPDNTPTVLFVTLQNFVPISASAQMQFSINGSMFLSNVQVLFSSRSSTLVRIAFPAFAGSLHLGISLWNSLVAQSRSADYRLLVEAPPALSVVSLFPNTVEAASDTVVSVSLMHVPASTSDFFIRTSNRTLVANASLASAGGAVRVVQFTLKNCVVSGNPLVFDAASHLEIASHSDSSISAAFPFPLFVSAPSKPQIISPPHFTSLSITDAPLASFVLKNFGGLGNVSALLTVDSVSPLSLIVSSYKFDGIFGTVSIEFPRNVRVAGLAQVTIFASTSESALGATFSFIYVFPAPLVVPSLACTNGKSSGYIVLYETFPDDINDHHFQVAVNGAIAQIVSVQKMTASSVNISIVFPSLLTAGIVPLDVLFSPTNRNSTTFRSTVRYFYPPQVQSVSVTEISTLNRALLPVKVSLKYFPSVSNFMFSITTRSYSILTDSSEQSTYDSGDLSVITFFAPFLPTGSQSDVLKFEVACTDTSRFPRAVLDLLVVQFDIAYQAPSPSIIYIHPTSVDMGGGAMITVTAPAPQSCNQRRYCSLHWGSLG